MVPPIPYDPTWQALTAPQTRPVTPGFDRSWPLDALCAELSRLAYFGFETNKSSPGAQKDELTNALAAAGYGAPALFNGRLGAQAFATCDDEGTAFVVFRGTQPKGRWDLLIDALFVPFPLCSKGWVHGGFYWSYAALRTAIDSWVAQQRAPRLIVTGHSLGAAMATIMAAFHTTAELVTFGSPLVGNGSFARLFAERDVRRYVDCCDGVTRVPPAWLFTHVGGERYIDRTGAVLPVTPDAAARASDRRLARTAYRERYAGQQGNVLTRDLADHAPINYVSAVLDVRTEL